MEHISNEEKAKTLVDGLGIIYTDCNRVTIKKLLIKMAEWKDEQHTKEKQALIQEYENKLNKLNQREETFRDNVRRANSRYGFEGLF